MWVSLRKLEIIPGFHFYITEINSKHKSSFLFGLKVELMLLLAILNRLKSFRWYFLMFANNWIYWEVELLQHVNMKCNKTFYWYVKSFHLPIYWQVFVLYFNPTIFSLYKHYYKVISQGNGKLVAYTPCLKCHDHSKLTGLRRMYVGIGPLVCINNLLITPVGNVLMRLGCQGKGTEDFSRQWLFSTWKAIIMKATLVLVTHYYSDKLALKRIQHFIS